MDTLVNDLGTAASAGITAVGTPTATILIAALGIAVGFVTYKVVKRALGKA